MVRAHKTYGVSLVHISSCEMERGLLITYIFLNLCLECKDLRLKIIQLKYLLIQSSSPMIYTFLLGAVRFKMELGNVSSDGMTQELQGCGVLCL